MKEKAQKRNRDGARKELVGQTRDQKGKAKGKGKKAEPETLDIPMYSGYVELPVIPGHPERPRYQHVLTMAALYHMAEGTMEVLYLFGFSDIKRALAINEGKALEGGLERLAIKHFHFRPFEEGDEVLPMMFNFSNFYSAEREFLFSEVKSNIICKEDGKVTTEERRVKYTPESHTPKTILVSKSTSYWAIPAVNAFMNMEMFKPTEELRKEMEKTKAEVDVKKAAKYAAKAKAEAEEKKPINRNARKFDQFTLRAVSGALKAAGYDIHMVYNTKENVLEVVKNAPSKGCVTNLGDVLGAAAQQA